MLLVNFAHRTSASMLDKGKIHGTIMDIGWNHREYKTTEHGSVCTIVARKDGIEAASQPAEN